MMEADKSVSGPINLGNPNEFTMLELAQKVIKLTNSESKIIYQPLPEDDPRQRQPNIDKAKNILGWQPVTQLNEGLDKTVTYFEGVVLND
jgi:UDP-glucuronate decarboxylase